MNQFNAQPEEEVHTSVSSATCRVISSGTAHTCTVTTVKVKHGLNHLIGSQVPTTGEVPTQVQTLNDLLERNSIKQEESI